MLLGFAWEQHHYRHGIGRQDECNGQEEIAVGWVVGVGLFFGLLLVTILYGQVLKALLGDKRYVLFTHSPMSAASVGVNYHGLRFWNAAIMVVVSLIVATVFPEHAMAFGIACGLSLAILTGYFAGGVVVAVVISWLLF